MSTPAATSKQTPIALISIAILALLMCFFFSKSFSSDQAVFSNDGPLGANVAEQAKVPEIFTGTWADLNWVGGHAGSALPNLTYGLLYLVGPVNYAKFYAPVSLLLLGLAAWFFFRRLKFHPAVCLIGGIAAMLNINVFSNSCWGLASRATMLASIFFALAMIPQPGSRWQIPKLILAGFGVGMGIMEGYDIGAIYSLYVGAFAVFVTLIAPGNTLQKLTAGLAKGALIAVAAGLLAAAALITLIQTQVQGVVGMGQDAKTKEARWDEATAWSLPKVESLRVLVPGLFGYRMDTPDGGNYWGLVGQTPGWSEHHQGLIRHSGSGEYAGVLVMLIAAWAFAQALRETGGPYSKLESRIILFWAAAAIVSLVLAWGRHGPLYRIFYSLPYFSTIRNPIKFMHPFHLSIGIMFGYGLQGLWRKHLSIVTRSNDLLAAVQAFFKNGPAFERKWFYGAIAFAAVSVIGWLLFAASKNELTTFLGSTGFKEDQVTAILKYANGELGAYLACLILSLGVLAMISSGAMAGGKARAAFILIGLVVTIDLARADRPWISYYNYKESYATNPILDILRDKPYDHRVTAPQYLVAQGLEYFPQICNDWLQHHFQYYNVQSLDIIQMPREPEDYRAFRINLPPPKSDPRRWELTNTRYVLAPAGFLDVINQQLDPAKKRFRIHTAFRFTQSEAGGPIHTELNPAGPLALFEFTGAMPRVRLFANWTSSPVDTNTLSTLASPEFDPHTQVLVSSEIPAPAKTLVAVTNQPGNVGITKYSPKHLELAAQVTQPAVMLLNDKFDPQWIAVDNGHRVDILRCNYLMRGLYLQPGEHTITFDFKPATTGLKLSLAALIIGLGLCVFLAVVDRPPVETTKPA